MFKFGDIIRNEYTTPENPHHEAIFIKKQGRWLLMTDGKGRTWQQHSDPGKNTKIGTVLRSER